MASEATSFCIHCGVKSPSNAKFCLSCGKSIPHTEPGQKTVVASGAPVPPSQPEKEKGDKHKVNHWDASHENIVNGLKKLYESKLKPLEAAYKFDQFHSPLLTNTDFEAKPMVLLLGQYSVGKTSFIQYLLERDFPGQRVGPEPTTDRFVAVMYSEDERITPGNALAVQADMPFRALQKYGMGFLNKFEASMCPSPILKKITFVDTPGVLSGEKQRLGRSYDFSDVIEWFAERSDRILLLFDAHKLDISDEFKRVIETLRGHDDKIRVVLNKADMVTNQQLMRVYGALMWSLGKVIRTPEVLRVYIGSFWDHDYQIKDNKALFEAEKNDLLSDLRSLPRNSAVRKVNELVKRSRCAKVHAQIVNYMREQFGFFGKDSTQEELLATLPEVFKKVQSAYNLPAGDFPNPDRFREAISKYKIWEFPKLEKKAIPLIEEFLGNDIPALLKLIPIHHEDAPPSGISSILNPFDDVNQVMEKNWIIESGDKMRYDNMFFGLNVENDRVKGSDCKSIFVRSGLTVEQLKSIWNLCDFLKRGALDAEEFACAMYLIEHVKSGNMQIPERLPVALIPPSKRHLVPHALYDE